MRLIKLKNNEFATEIILINSWEVESFEAMYSYMNTEPPDHIPHIQCKAVIDTGATRTMISEKIAQKLNLIKTGEIICKVAGGREIEGDLYSAMICFPEKHIIMMNVGALKGSKNSEALIGMDFYGRRIFLTNPISQINNQSILLVAN